MSFQDLILVSDFCAHYHIQDDFIFFLEEKGIITTITVEESVYVKPEQLVHLEKFVRLHQDLAIHPDDLDIVVHLLERIESLQEEVSLLKKRLDVTGR